LPGDFDATLGGGIGVKSSDYAGIAMFGGFGLWWVLFPKSVIRFYTWFHRGRISLAGTREWMIRLIGGLVIALVLATYFARK
jgi:hypothetical protein